MINKINTLLIADTHMKILNNEFINVRTFFIFQFMLLMTGNNVTEYFIYSNMLDCSNSVQYVKCIVYSV